MRQYSRNLQAKQMAFVRNQFAQVEGLPFSNVLTAATVALTFWLSLGR